MPPRGACLLRDRLSLLHFRRLLLAATATLCLLLLLLLLRAARAGVMDDDDDEEEDLSVAALIATVSGPVQSASSCCLVSAIEASSVTLLLRQGVTSPSLLGSGGLRGTRSTTQAQPWALRSNLSTSS